MLALLLTLVLSAVPPPGAQTRTPDARVSGRIVDEGTGAPVSRARVVLTSRANVQLETATDQDGRYAFVDLEPGPYGLSVQRVGYVTPNPNQLQTFALLGGQALELAPISLQRTGVIAGRILDPFGEPLQDANVRAVRRGTSERTPGRERVADLLMQNIRTNDLGEFRVFGLVPGEYVIAASPQPFGLATAQISTAVLPATYYPGTADESAAEALVLGAGQTINIEFSILSAPAFNISGMVVDEGGSPVVKAAVILRADARGGGGFAGTVTQTESDEVGRFVIRQVPSGSYFAIGPGFEPVEIRVDDADVEGLTIVVRR